MRDLTVAPVRAAHMRAIPLDTTAIAFHDTASSLALRTEGLQWALVASTNVVPLRSSRVATCDLLAVRVMVFTFCVAVGSAGVSGASSSSSDADASSSTS